MIRRAFPAEVTNGQLRFQTSLQDLEGRRVMVVVNECESPASPWPRLMPEAPIDDAADSSEELDFQRPFQRNAATVQVKDGGKLQPSFARFFMKVGLPVDVPPFA